MVHVINVYGRHEMCKSRKYSIINNVFFSNRVHETKITAYLWIFAHFFPEMCVDVDVLLTAESKASLIFFKILFFCFGDYGGGRIGDSHVVSPGCRARGDEPTAACLGDST